MDINTRIQRRRQHTGDETRLILDYDAISPAAHVEEPTGRGPVLERLLDYVDPVFEERLPPNAYVWGLPGAGKSALITAIFARLRRHRSLSGSVIHTSTRGGTGMPPDLVYVDARFADSDFGLYRSVLNGLLDEVVPEHGVGTDALRSRLSEYLSPHERRVLIAVDHVGERTTHHLTDLAGAFGGVDGSLSWVAVGRRSPSSLSSDARPPERIEVPAYDDDGLLDILTVRASAGLARRAIEHEQLRRIASWAESDAHNALAALFAAADVANDRGASHVRERDLEAGMDAVPYPSVSLGRVLALPDNHQRVLRRLVDLEEEQRASVDAATEAIAGSADIDLSAGTVKRLLYELANASIAERVVSDHAPGGVGRPPSRLELHFPAAVFRRLYDRSS